MYNMMTREEMLTDVIMHNGMENKWTVWFATIYQDYPLLPLHYLDTFRRTAISMAEMEVTEIETVAEF